MKVEDYLTVSEAAHELSVGLSAVNNALSRSRLPYSVAFGRKIISRADLDTYKQRTRPEGKKPRGRPRKQKVERMAVAIHKIVKPERREAQDGTAWVEEIGRV